MSKKVQDDIFEKEYKNLNKSQKMAVDSIEGPVMVIAGPGTGKTTILTLRIANILKQTDTPPSGILALTFTESGVKSMKAKLRKVVGERADEVRIHTFHGFASAVISEFSEHFPHLSRSKQVTDIEAGAMVRNIIKDKKFSKLRPLGEPDFYINKILSAIGDSKKEAQSPENVRSFAKEEIDRIKNDPNSISSRGASKGELKADAQKRIDKCEKTILFSEVYEEYEKKKKDEYKMDFDDLLYELLLALKNDELLLRLLQEKFLYIHVDEHQDTNDSQNLIVSYLANFFESPNLFVVGDEKQAIYRFQGASVENFLKFQNTWKDMKIISLEENYRSHQDILDATFSMIEKNYEEGEHEKLRVKLKSGASHNARPIDFVEAGNVSAGDNFIVNEIQNITKSEPDATVAVILRWNKDVDYILNLCQQNELSVSAERGVDIFSHPLGVMYFTLLEYVDDPANLEPLGISVASGLWNLNFEDSIDVLRAIKSENFDAIKQKLPILDELRHRIIDLGPISFITLLGDVSGLISPNRMKDPLYAEVWRAIVELAKDIAESLNVHDTKELVKEIMNYKKTAESKTVKIGSGVQDSKVQIMTAHSSKGLEFDYVFIPFALEEYWMKKSRGSSFILPKERDEGDYVKDSRRLFYVSLTRAKKHAVIISPRYADSGEELLPLRFVDELDIGSLRKVTLGSEDANIRVQTLEEISHLKTKELQNYSARVLLEKGLSVTSLNHFIKCPSQYLYKSILKIPEAPSPTSEKGIAMHKAISEVWKSKNKSKKDIKNIIDGVVKAYFDVSLLTKSEKEVILEELLADSVKVASALEDHFAMKGEVFTDKWLEKIIGVSVNGLEREIILHGQMDSIVSGEKIANVFDYKTKIAMSDNEIKGLTKNSDGNYFRQLVFYKILLEASSLFKSKKVETSLVFIKPDPKGVCRVSTLEVGRVDEEKLLYEVSVLVKSVLDGSFLQGKCDDPECIYCKYKDILTN